MNKNTKNQQKYLFGKNIYLRMGQNEMFLTGKEVLTQWLKQQM